MDKELSRRRVEGRIKPPSSKSYAQRAIAAALLSKGRTVIHGLEMCDDTRSALSTAQALGAGVETDDPLSQTYTITGGLSPRSHTLDIGESGLATRLFTPIAALCAEPVAVTGRGSILSRPMDMMIAPLRALGVKVADNGGYLPITVQGPLPGGEIEVDGSVSSQFITGLLMALPLAEQDTVLHVKGLKSIPYIDMTIDLAGKFGVDIEHNDYEEFFIEGGQEYACPDYSIEGDWSGASCMLVAGAVGGSVTLENLNPLSIQADVAIIEALSRAGARITTTENSVTVEKAELQAFEFDATHCPDLFPALVALAAHCEGVSVIYGIHRLVHKESNRAETLREEYGKLGIEIDMDTQEDMMFVTGGAIKGGAVESHGDHRIAMSLAVASLNATDLVTIHGAESVAKSYPDFWEDFLMISKNE